MCVRPVSYILLILLIIYAVIDICELSPFIFEGNAFFKSYVENYMNWVNQRKFMALVVRIPSLELMLYFGSIFSFNILNIVFMMNMFIMRYIQSHNMKLVIQNFRMRLEQILVQYPTVNRYYLPAKQMIANGFQRAVDFHQRLRQM